MSCIGLLSKAVKVRIVALALRVNGCLVGFIQLAIIQTFFYKPFTLVSSGSFSMWPCTRSKEQKFLAATRQRRAASPGLRWDHHLTSVHCHCLCRLTLSYPLFHPLSHPPAVLVGQSLGNNCGRQRGNLKMESSPIGLTTNTSSAYVTFTANGKRMMS